MSIPTKTVGVVGTGVIGASWTLLFLARGCKVVVSDPAPTAEEHLTEYIDQQWPIVESLGLHPSASKQNYKFVKDITPELPSLDFVQENAPERVELKKSLFASLSAGLRPDVVIASSSSGLPSSEFVQNCKNPERVLIGHPFNPPHVIPLVEIVPHQGTSQAAIETARDFYASLGKDPVLLNRECPGFIANRLQAVLCNEAYSLVSRGLVSAKDLDTTVTSGLGLRWAAVGPFMANALGGGGGATGFAHILEHLGPASDVWLSDAKQHAFSLHDTEKKKALIESVAQMLEGTDVTKIEYIRDTLLTSIVKQKASV